MTSAIQEYDTVQLVEKVEDVPEGSVGVVLTIYGDQAEVEFTSATSKMSYTVSLLSIERLLWEK